MSNSLSILLFVLVAAAIRSTNANIQEWGFEDQNTQMAYEYIERQPKGIKRVELNFPYFVSIPPHYTLVKIEPKWAICHL